MFQVWNSGDSSTASNRTVQIVCMLPIREIFERHGRAVPLEDLPSDYKNLIAADVVSSARAPAAYRPVEDTLTMWIVEQDKPSGTENFIAEFLSNPTPMELMVFFREGPLPRVVTLDAPTIRLLGVGRKEITRAKIKRVMDE